MATLLFVGQFVASKVGKTGLTVTVDVDRYALADGSRTALITGGSATEGRRGLYAYRLAGADLSLYQYVATFVTADTTVDQCEVAALGLVVPDELISSRAPGSTALSNAVWTDAKAAALDAAVSSRLASASYAAPDNAGVAAIQAVTDKLDTTLAQDGAVYGFTADALANAPTANASLSEADKQAIGDYAWTRTPRTLTTPAATSATQATAGALEIVRGATFTATLDGLNYPAGWTALYVTVKRDYATDDDDADALLQLRLSDPAAAGDGLLRLNGAAATAAQGSLATGATALTVTLDAAVTAQLPARAGYTYDVKFLLHAGTSLLERRGDLAVTATPTMAR